MDTDELTEMAYETIRRAGNILDVLRSEIGASASDKETEDEFLVGVSSQLRGILKSPVSYLDLWDYEEEVDAEVFRQNVIELLAYVENVLATPYEQRGETAYE